jgi:hypothetical protein
MHMVLGLHALCSTALTAGDRPVKQRVVHAKMFAACMVVFLCMKGYVWA